MTDEKSQRIYIRFNSGNLSPEQLNDIIEMLKSLTDDDGIEVEEVRDRPRRS